jgi:predicted outer membrane repeat protein
MGGGIFVNDGGSLTLSGSGSKVIQNTADSSTIPSSSTIDKNAYGGGIFCYGSMTMTDGTISENTLVAGSSDAKYGGGIALVAIGPTSSSTFTMSGGTISKNSAKLGGGISTQGIDLTLSGGTIGASTYDDGNTATQFGGGLYVGPYRSGLSTKKPDCTISGCTIKYNTANESGGGIFAEECTMSFSSGSVSNNKVYSDSAIYISGGGVYIKKGSLGISGTAEISNNMVSAGSGTLGVSGGGLFIYENGNVTMEGGSIKANIVSSSIASMGGGVYITNGKMTLSGGTIISNTASDTSGSIVPGGAMGGGFFINNSGELTMTGGSINSNTASTTNGSCFGGGIYSSGKLTLTSGELKSNSSSTMGGGIFVSPSVGSTDCSLTWNSTTITGNTASTIAPNYYINTGVIFTGQINGTGTTYSGTPISQQYD